MFVCNKLLHRLLLLRSSMIYMTFENSDPITRVPQVSHSPSNMDEVILFEKTRKKNKPDLVKISQKQALKSEILKKIDQVEKLNKRFKVPDAGLKTSQLIDTSLYWKKYQHVQFPKIPHPKSIQKPAPRPNPNKSCSSNLHSQKHTSKTFYFTQKDIENEDLRKIMKLISGCYIEEYRDDTVIGLKTLRMFKKSFKTFEEIYNLVEQRIRNAIINVNELRPGTLGAYVLANQTQIRNQRVLPEVFQDLAPYQRKVSLTSVENTVPYVTEYNQLGMPKRNKTEANTLQRLPKKRNLERKRWSQADRVLTYLCKIKKRLLQ